MVAPSKLGFLKLRRILVELFMQSGLPVNKALIAKRVGTSAPTVSRFLDAFESLFLIKKHGSTYYPSDLGLLNHLLSEPDFLDRLTWLRILYVELRAQLEYQYRGLYEFEEAKTRGGMDIPFLITIRKIGKFAFTLDSDSRSSDKSLKSLSWFKKRLPEAKTFALHLGNSAYLSSAGHLCIPLMWIF
jgi:predicted AAA+ superfamily ATPase